MKINLKKNLRSLLLALISACLLIGGLPYASAPASALYEDPFEKYGNVLKIGLRFASNGSQVYSARLQNYVGNGFYIGYYDDSRVFHELDTVRATTVDVSYSGSRITVDGDTYDTAGYRLAVAPRGSSGEVCLTWFDYSKYYGAFEFYAEPHGGMAVINVIDAQLYLRGVVPSEMPASWELEALKAQALCARTFAATHMLHEGGYHDGAGFDLCNTTCCQAYNGRGTSATAESVYAKTDRAVEETDGMFIYYDGELCHTYYHSSNGGATESCENVWVEDYPYLAGRIDEWDGVIQQTYSSWEFSLTGKQIATVLTNKGYNIGAVTSITPVYTATGNIYSVTFSDGSRTVTLSKQYAGLLSSWFSSAYATRYYYSQHFTITGSSAAGYAIYINSAENIIDDLGSAYAVGSGGTASKITKTNGKVSVLTGDGMKAINASGASGGNVQTGASFTFTGGGWGHNVGMSQYGAYAMAQAGNTYKDIIEYYYNGVTIR